MVPWEILISNIESMLGHGSAELGVRPLAPYPRGVLAMDKEHSEF